MWVIEYQQQKIMPWSWDSWNYWYGGAGFIGSNFIYYIQDRYPDYELCALICSHMGPKNIGQGFKRTILFYKAIYLTGKRFSACLKRSLFLSILRRRAMLTAQLKTPPFSSDKYNRHSGFNGRLPQIWCEKVPSGFDRWGQRPSAWEGGFFSLEKLPFTPPPVFGIKNRPVCVQHYRTFGLPVTISRCSNNYRHINSRKAHPLIISEHWWTKVSRLR